MIFTLSRDVVIAIGYGSLSATAKATLELVRRRPNQSRLWPLIDDDLAFARGRDVLLRGWLAMEDTK